jgi:uncharacterized membrane protein
MESRKRSIVKSISWRMLGIVVLATVTWFMTLSLEITTAVTALFHIINVILYYFHERIWHGIEWGLKNKSELTAKEKEKMMERLRRLGYVD